MNNNENMKSQSIFSDQATLVERDPPSDHEEPSNPDEAANAELKPQAKKHWAHVAVDYAVNAVMYTAMLIF